MTEDERALYAKMRTLNKNSVFSVGEADTRWSIEI